jgi:hypothetical protein
VVGGPAGAGPRIAAPAAVRVARALAELGYDAARATGRVCLVSDAKPLAAMLDRRACPVVVDVAHVSPPAEGLGHADLTVLVAAPAVEAALVAAVESSLVAGGHRVEVVANRVEYREPEDAGHTASPDAGSLGGRLEIGESRLAAQLALACREARGPFARPIAELADRCRAAACG